MKAWKSILITTLCCSCITAYAQFSNAIIFGDSLSDSGNPQPLAGEVKDIGNNSWVTINDAHGKVIQTGAPITNKNPGVIRLSWVNDFVTELFSKNVFPSSQARKLTQQVDPYRDNVDYAWAAAETGHYINDLNPQGPSWNDKECANNGPGKISDTDSCVPGVLQQIALYFSDLKNNKHDSANPNTLFIIWAGGNDIFDNLEKLLQSSQAKKSPSLTIQRAFQPVLTGSGKQYLLTNTQLSQPSLNLKKAVTLLIDHGVKPSQIYVVNMPNLAITPAANQIAELLANKNPLVKQVLLDIFKYMSESFNSNLEFMLSSGWVKPASDIPANHILSAYNFLDKVVANPQEFGFIDVSDACIDKDALPYCVGYLFYNGKHPTASAHSALASFLLSKLDS